jgi:hypothetical protein
MNNRRLALILFSGVALALAACSSSSAPPATASMPTLTVAPAGSCNIDAMKMCQTTDAGPASSAPSSAPAAPYGASTMPDSVEFQIPAGQTIRLMCYFNPQRTALVRADATPLSELTTNSVDYLKAQGFCAR